MHDIFAHARERDVTCECIICNKSLGIVDLHSRCPGVDSTLNTGSPLRDFKSLRLKVFTLTEIDILKGSYIKKWRSTLRLSFPCGGVVLQSHSEI